MPQNSSIYHRIALIPQPTRTTCWAASTAMLVGSTVAAVRARTPAGLIASDGGLRNYSNQSDWFTGTTQYANTHGLGFSAPMSWTVGALHSRLSCGPMMFDMLWRPGQYTSGVGSPGHMVCIIGMSGEGANTTLTVNDPWPPNVGKIETVNYYQWMAQVATRTYRVFWRR